MAVLPAMAGTAGPSLVFDAATGEVLSQERAGEPWYPASLTKLMTAYLVFGKIRNGELRLDQKISVSETAHSQPPSKIGVPVGKTVSVDFALQALLVYSANDMAYVLAEAAAGSAEAFARQMSARAADLGMTGTHFVNPNGLFEPRNVSTARDIGLLAAAILRDYPEHAHYFSQPYLAVGKRKLMNRNSLIRQMKDSDGMKTGFVCNSGFNLVASATRDGRKLVAVIFGTDSGKTRVDLAQMLLTDGFTKPTAAKRTRLADIANQQLGSVVPADMTGNVCKQKPAVTLVGGKALTGWGISLGQYDTPLKADMALRGRLLSPAARDAGGAAGVVKVPGQSGFAAMLWNIGPQASIALCSMYRSANAFCDVMTPETFAHIAALDTDSEVSETKPQAQGSDDSGKNKKKKKISAPKQP